MALDSQQKRMAAAGAVFPQGLSSSQRFVIGNAYPAASLQVLKVWEYVMPAYVGLKRKVLSSQLTSRLRYK